MFSKTLRFDAGLYGSMLQVPPSPTSQTLSLPREGAQGWLRLSSSRHDTVWAGREDHTLHGTWGTTAFFFLVLSLVSGPFFPSLLIWKKGRLSSPQAQSPRFHHTRRLWPTKRLIMDNWHRKSQESRATEEEPIRDLLLLEYPECSRNQHRSV